MIETVLTRRFPAPPFRLGEAMRYAGCPGDARFASEIENVLEEMGPALRYDVCYREFPFRKDGDTLDLGFCRVESDSLSDRLAGCGRILLFAATVGLAPDRTSAKYGRISPVRSLFAEAVGDERIESLCDLFCETFSAEQCITLRSRFSPGYGDLSLSVQADIFRYLDCSRRIGLTLTEALTMSPVKSVTAIAGVAE